MDLDFILEIGCEEIPARLIPSLLNQLAAKTIEALEESQLPYSPPRLFATPRRLGLVIEQLSEKQPDRSELITGPPLTAAFDSQGEPTKAAHGFARKYLVSLEQIKTVETEKGKYLGFEHRIAGEKSRHLLSRAVPRILTELEFPKGMRWEESGFYFIRPIRWILCLLGGEVVPFSVAGVQSSNFTFGNRILSNNSQVTVSNSGEYGEQLKSLFVEVHPDVRRRKIHSDLEEVCSRYQCLLHQDEALLDQVTHLHEFPSVVSGTFDSRFLSLPQEVLVTVMREHQKYFSMVNEEGRLVARFLAVVDSDPKFAQTVVSGHERVLKARLEDASFFWEVDRRLTLDSRLETLKRVVFQAELGSMYEKTQRLINLAEVLALRLGFPEKVPDLQQAARLCKADLTTEMVKEFTDLQGIIGGLYARNEGLSTTVSASIYEHYLPNSWEDNLPESVEGALLALADKIDTVVGMFSVGVVPSGSKDPLGLRRQALGILKIILNKKFSISLESIFHKAFIFLRKRAKRPYQEFRSELFLFFKERLRSVFRELGYRYDEINSIVEIDIDNPLECMEKISAISAMRGSEDFYAVSRSFKRIKNIILKAGLSVDLPFRVDPALFEAEEEKALGRLISKTRPKVKRAAAAHEFRQAFELMASMRPQIDLFFDKVLVMAESPELQKNRLALLGSLLKIFYQLADVSEVVLDSATMSS